MKVISRKPIARYVFVWRKSKHILIETDSLRWHCILTRMEHPVRMRLSNVCDSVESCFRLLTTTV